jgi:chorismate mutase
VVTFGLPAAQFPPAVRGGTAVPVRAVRGATTVSRDDRDEVLAVTRDLLRELLDSNGLVPEAFLSVIFTATNDIRSVAPALAARQIGFDDVALICLQEMDVDGAMPLVVRVLAHVETEKPRESIVNVYLRGTGALREGVPPLPDDVGSAAGRR